MIERTEAAPPPTLYAAEAAEAGRIDVWPSFEGARRADVAIVGGGLTGLSAALHLAEAGREVVLLEAGRIASGASGRSGGQLHTGQRRDQLWLEQMVGEAAARRLWQLDREAHALVHRLIDRHRIACDWRAGLITATHRPRIAEAEWRYAEHLARAYGYREIEPLDRAELAAAIGTERYFGGVRDRGGGHLDPYHLTLGIARAASAAGAILHEQSRVRRIEPAIAPTSALALATGSACGSGSAPRAARGVGWRLVADGGTLECRSLIVAANGLIGDLVPGIAARLLPLDNTIIATAPLAGDTLERLIPGGEAVADTRRVVRYWRPVAGRRLVFGGGERYTRREQRDVAGFVRPYLAEVYPQLADAEIDHAWSGTLAITRTRCPLIGEVAPGLYTGCGYSGHGIGTASFAGKAIAEAICGDRSALDPFAALPVPRFPGGVRLRAPLLALAMGWGALRDRL